MMVSIRHNSRGVALLAALFVLMVMSILAIGMLSNVDEDLKISKNYENSERALKIAEHGVQIARATFFDPAQKDIRPGEDQPVLSVNGFINGGYFLTYLTSGFSGNETWTQWRYDFGLSGNNAESEITAPLFNVWGTNQLGVNGYWTTDASGNPDSFYLDNIYGVVATGVYFPIEQAGTTTTDTTVRSHHEYTGAWVSDRNVIGGGGTSFAASVSPFASYTRYKDRSTLREQVLYFTYRGGPAHATGAETQSTVRLRAVNVNPNTASALTDKKGNLDRNWEFDTGLHGVATAPTMFDPTPPDPGNTDNRHRGDEIIYFAVISTGKPTTAGWSYAYTYPPGTVRTHDFNEASFDLRSFPVQADQFPEQIYLFAVVDTLTGFRLKWARPFPDPDVAEWTDYPMEHATGTLGQRRPFVGRPSDIAPYPLEDDFLTDYRDGPGRSGIVSNRGQDQQWNQVRGDLMGESAACSPPVLNVFYRTSGGALTTNYQDATPASRMNPEIDIYLMYTNITRGTMLNYDKGGTYPRPVYGGPGGTTGAVKRPDNSDGSGGWGDPGYRKTNAVQTRVIALRDRLVPRNATAANDIATNDWRWDHARSRFPEFKWMYRVPGRDPNETDTIPATGYGEYSWDTWFSDRVAPMVIAQYRNSETVGDADSRRGNDQGSPFPITNASGARVSGARGAYPVVYAYYRSQGFPTGGGDGKATNYNTYNAPPTATLSAGITFTNGWDDNRIMAMAMRDTWDDYRAGNRTNIIGASNANPDISNPVEPYWYYSANDQTSGPNVADYTYQNGKPMVVYNASYLEMGGATARRSPYMVGVQAGFPRPYNFSESLWLRNVKEALAAEEWSMNSQGWSGIGVRSGQDSVYDSDIEGETAAICTECLGGDGLFVLPFNIDMTDTGGNSREDLRMHGINARTGLHVWDYHAASSQAGDNANNTPAIANNKVFFAHVKFDAETRRDNRQAIVTVLDASDGSRIGDQKVFDEDADAVVLPPTIANGMVYIATYDYAGPNPAATCTSTGCSWTRMTYSDDLIRLFALSPIIRLVSTGVYPVDFKDKARITNYSSLLVDRGSKYGNKRIGQSRRKLQVWVTGDTSRWEELKENIE